MSASSARPVRCRPPHHPHAFEPPPLDFKESYDVASDSWRALAAEEALERAMRGRTTARRHNIVPATSSTRMLNSRFVSKMAWRAML